MPATDSPAIIVARYLKANNYTESYEAFVSEAGISYDAGNVLKGDLTLETLLEEKRIFDVSIRFEKLGLEGDSQWSKPAPSTSNEVKTLPTKSNLLSVQFDELEGDDKSAVLIATTADRRLSILDGSTSTLRTSLTAIHDSPILSCLVIRKTFLLTASMSGHLHLSNADGRVLGSRKDHSKYVVKIVSFDEQGETFIATAGWDCKVCIYKYPATSEPQLGEPFAVIILISKPEALQFLRHPETSKPVLLLSRTDSSFMLYYTVEETPRLIGKQNLAPHSNAWVAFTPSAFELSPTNPKLLAVATSSVPHMKLLVVRLLFPPWDDDAEPLPPATVVRASILDEGSTPLTQASQARAALVVADREAEAIRIHCTTMAPQTAFSTPAVAWRPDGSGVWVNGDDGVVRGIETSSGKVVSTLRGHEPGSKIRCLCAGKVGEDEVLASGGFDQKLIIWRI